MNSTAPTDVTFMVMDESDSPETGLLSLTALLVPARKMSSITRSFFRFLHELQGLPPNHFDMSVTELHGSAMLKDVPWADDAKRQDCFRFAVDSANANKLRILRCAYRRDTVQQLLPNDSKLHGLCFFGLLSMAQPELSRSMLVPIMDGFGKQQVERIAGLVRSIHLTAGSGLSDDSISIRNTENLSEAYFASSRHSALIQLVDMLSYLLHVRDLVRQSGTVTAFKKQLGVIVDSLDETLVRDEVVAMHLGP